ncbi:DUF6979 family protein [Algibacter pectinivorans]|uniref:Uncharacterized protein n=1 Tax=Algibacter pectinivorans TaxID=870482 RepID=A0A1I1R9Q1_9FLAO|nr:hypothetical protein [Algibacter pectinivorans]SFD28293.1 hypothetical protein SAMN04487987_10879 [Algibacter pectinivorans]
MNLKKENKYGLAAKEAALIGGNPIEAWRAAVQNFDSESAKLKGCPKNAFLGLCEAGLVKGIKSGSYFTRKKENLNKKYAITAVNLLATNPCLNKNELWKEVREKLVLGEKKHNSQMDVVLALWNKKLIQFN